MSGRTIEPLSSAQLAEVALWSEENAASLPPAVVAALSQHQALVLGLKGSQRKLSQILTELRRALGVLPKSERRSSGDQLGPVSLGDGCKPKGKRAQLELGIERNKRLRDWHRGLAKKKDAKREAFEKKKAEMTEDDFELTPEEQAEHAREVEEETQRMLLGEGSDPSLQSTRETLMTGSPLATSEREVTLEAEFDGGEEENIKVLSEISESRERYDFSFSLTRVSVNLKKKVVVGEDGERRIISPSTAELGPKGFSVTWGFLAHMAVLVVQYAMPLNRLAKLLSTEAKRFSAGMLGRHLHYVGVRLAPIYLELLDQLADSGVLTGDDTPSRVTEVSRYFAKSQGEEEEVPWSRYATPERAFESVVTYGDTSLGCELGAELQFESERRDGKGKKQSLNTTTISGRSIADDPRSLIVLYRSHLGGFGNLLEMLLNKRNPLARELVTQTDLATVNLVQDPKLLERFNLRSAGCMSHARRPFAIHEQEDPLYCDVMLHQFKGLAILEHGLNLVGRNRENVSAVRGVDSRALWEKIKSIAARMTKTWSQATKLGTAARYIIRHYDKLTAYLDDPRLDLTNNFSERMLRMENQMEKSSMFRTTLEGRFALDIVRSLLQTAVAAGVPVEKYLLYVLTADPAAVAAAPAEFTPQAWSVTLAAAAQQDADTDEAQAAAS